MEKQNDYDEKFIRKISRENELTWLITASLKKYRLLINLVTRRTS